MFLLELFSVQSLIILFKGLDLLKLNESIKLLFSSFIELFCSFCLFIVTTTGGKTKYSSEESALKYLMNLSRLFMSESLKVKYG